MKPPIPAWQPKTVEPLAPGFLQPCTRPSRGPLRSLTVASLIGDQRGDGETPVGLRKYERAAGEAVPLHSTENSQEPIFRLFAVCGGMGIAAPRRTSRFLVSLTPNFSWVGFAPGELQPLQRFALPGLSEPPLWKTAEAVGARASLHPPN